ncbi:Imm1 family immunity protein [Actinocorallia aurea]
MMLALHAFFRGQVYYSLSGIRLDRFVDEVLSPSDSGGGPLPGGGTGETLATFVLAAPHRNPTRPDMEFDSYLQVMANLQSMHGALKWLLPTGSVVSVDESLAGNVWLSDNPEPPAVDPLVVADMDSGLTIDLRCTFPVSKVRVAVDEFCGLRTGKRPDSIGWIPGDFSGHRIGDEVVNDNSRYCEDPWCQVSDSPHNYH